MDAGVQQSHVDSTSMKQLFPVCSLQQPNDHCVTWNKGKNEGGFTKLFMVLWWVLRFLFLLAPSQNGLGWKGCKSSSSTLPQEAGT